MLYSLRGYFGNLFWQINKTKSCLPMWMLKGWSYYSIALKCIWKIWYRYDIYQYQYDWYDAAFIKNSDQFHVAFICFHVLYPKCLWIIAFLKGGIILCLYIFPLISTCNNTLIVPLLYNAIYTQYWQRNCLLPIADYHNH